MNKSQCKNRNYSSDTQLRHALVYDTGSVNNVLTTPTTIFRSELTFRPDNRLKCRGSKTQSHVEWSKFMLKSRSGARLALVLLHCSHSTAIAVQWINLCWSAAAELMTTRDDEVTQPRPTLSGDSGPKIDKNLLVFFVLFLDDDIHFYSFSTSEFSIYRVWNLDLSLLRKV